MSQCAPNQIIIGGALIILGIPVYLIFAPRTEIKTARRDLEKVKIMFHRPLRGMKYFLQNSLNKYVN